MDCKADALYQEGYTYQVYTGNDQAPKNYTKDRLSPLHARVMSLFDALEEDNHRCTMDNLYNSASFCPAAVNHSRKVRCHGVTRKGGRGMPPCVLQEEATTKKDMLSRRGIVKAAVLEGDD